MPVPARIVVQPPPRPGCGDYASHVALQLAGPAGRPAREVAEILRKRLVGSAGIARVEIAGPGFLNFTLGDGAQVALVREVLAQGDGYGGSRAGQDPDAFGPVDGSPAGGAREAVIDEVLARIDAAAGPGGRRGGGHPALAPVPYDLATLIARLGSDEARWVLLRPAAHDPVRVPERPVQRESNPRFRVQYAYARVRALVRNAGELGFVSEPGEVGRPLTDGGSSSSPGERSAPLVSPRRSTPRPPPTPSRASMLWRPFSPPSPPSSKSPRGCGRRTGWCAIWRRRRTRSSGGMTSFRRCPSGSRNPWPCTAPGWPLPRPAGRCSPTACVCSASPLPNTSERF